jgi:pyruvate dehydrogenase E1 component beta subunit
MVAAIQDDDPVIFIDERWLYGEEGPVPTQLYAERISTAACRQEGRDVTILAFSYLAPKALEAAATLAEEDLL